MSIAPHLSIILQLPNALATASAEVWQQEIQTGLSLPVAATSTQQWFWINPELENIPVESVRQLTTQLSYGTQPHVHQIVVILAADQAQRSAQNALLKLIEEPPAQTTLILATTNPSGLLPTLHSRCQLIHLSTTPDLEVTSQLPELEQDVATLLKFSQNSATVSYSELITVAGRYKDRQSAKQLLAHWLQAISENTSNCSPGALELASSAIAALTDLDANINPSLTLEHLWFAWKQTH